LNYRNTKCKNICLPVNTGYDGKGIWFFCLLTTTLITSITSLIKYWFQIQRLFDMRRINSLYLFGFVSSSITEELFSFMLWQVLYTSLLDLSLLMVR